MPKSFCFTLTLQGGCSLTSAVLITLGCLVLTVNIPCLGLKLHTFVVLFWIFLTFLSAILIFLSAYHESRKLTLVACAVYLLTIIYWFILSIIPFLGSDLKTLDNICMDSRCAATLWLLDEDYRWYSQTTTTETSPSITTINTINPTANTTGSRTTFTLPDIIDCCHRGRKVRVRDLGFVQQNGENKFERKLYDLSSIFNLRKRRSESIKAKKEPMSYIYRIGNKKPRQLKVLAILIFIINICFFIYTFIMLISFWMFNDKDKDATLQSDDKGSPSEPTDSSKIEP